LIRLRDDTLNEKCCTQLFFFEDGGETLSFSDNILGMPLDVRFYKGDSILVVSEINNAILITLFDKSGKVSDSKSIELPSRYTLCHTPASESEIIRIVCSITEPLDLGSVVQFDNELHIFEINEALQITQKTILPFEDVDFQLHHVLETNTEELILAGIIDSPTLDVDIYVAKFQNPTNYSNR